MPGLRQPEVTKHKTFLVNEFMRKHSWLISFSTLKSMVIYRSARLISIGHGTFVFEVGCFSSIRNKVGARARFHLK